MLPTWWFYSQIQISLICGIFKIAGNDELLTEFLNSIDEKKFLSPQGKKSKGNVTGLMTGGSDSFTPASCRYFLSLLPVVTTCRHFQFDLPVMYLLECV